MARGGINKAIVQKAREALLARGENPSIDAAATHEDAAVRLTGEIAAMKTAVAKADGAKEALQEQLGMSRAESKRLEEGLSRASAQLVEATRLSLHYSAELTQLRQAAGHPHTDNENSTR